MLGGVVLFVPVICGTSEQKELYKKEIFSNEKKKKKQRVNGEDTLGAIIFWCSFKLGS